MAGAAINTLEALRNKQCLTLLVREQWLMNECHDEAAALYLQLSETSWIELVPNAREACRQILPTNSQKARAVFGDGDSHYSVRDAGEAYGLSGKRIENAYQRKLGEQIELCVEFSNATDLTLRYNVSTHESSLYFIKD